MKHGRFRKSEDGALRILALVLFPLVKHGIKLAILANLVIVANLKFFADDAMKVFLVHWLLVVNAHALGLVIYDAFVKPRAHN
jgi:hypothetical protein